MDLAPATAAAGLASGRCIARANRLVRVKFVGMPVEPAPEDALRETCASEGCAGAGRGPILEFIFRVIGRLVAARP